MKAFMFALLAAVLCFFSAGISHAQDESFPYLSSYSFFYIEDSVPFGRSDAKDLLGNVGPISASVADPIAGKASARGSANYGTLGAMVELDPDIGRDMRAVNDNSFSDVLTIDGSNTGAIATVVIRLQVNGLIQQPFIVSDTFGSVGASAQLGAASSLDSDYVDEVYRVQGTGSPVLTAFNDLLEVRIPFVVGESILAYASLGAVAHATALNVAPDVKTFSAMFDNTAELLPIVLEGVESPTIVAESGATYSIAVPEPASVILIGIAAVTCCGLRCNLHESRGKYAG